MRLAADGQWAETGYFQVSKEGTYVNAASAWNNVANTLFLESPAGAFLTPDDLHSGFSYCLKGGERQQRCSWNDVTQAEAYEATLKAWFAAFPEHAGKDLYLAGESYAGQYIPNIAARLLNGSLAPQLRGIAVGNGCWGGGADSVLCNGPNEARDLLELYHGKVVTRPPPLSPLSRLSPVLPPLSPLLSSPLPSPLPSPHL